MLTYLDQLIQWIFSCGDNKLLLNFKAGFCTGVSLVLGLLLLWTVVKLIHFRRSKKRLREIVISGAKGDLIVSATAINDLVKLVVDEKFKHVSIEKIALWKTPRGIEMELRGGFKLDGDHLPDLSNAMRDEIFKTLEDKFAITSIRKITCKV